MTWKILDYKSETPNSSLNYPKLRLRRRVGLFNLLLGRFGFCNPRLSSHGITSLSIKKLGFFQTKVSLPVTVPAQPGRQNFRCSTDSDFPSWLMSFSFYQFSWPYDREAWSSHRDLERREKKNKCKVTKGQLISKCLFGVFNFFQKTNKNKSTWGIIVVKSNLFVRFLEETLAWKNHFEFVWPLVRFI